MSDDLDSLRLLAWRFTGCTGLEARLAKSFVIKFKLAGVIIVLTLKKNITPTLRGCVDYSRDTHTLHVLLYDGN